MLSAREAFRVSFSRALAEVPALGREILTSVAVGPSAALAAAVKRWRAALHAAEPRQYADFLAAESPLRLSALPVPPRPRAASEFAAWADALDAAVRPAIAPASVEHRALRAGRVLGDAWVALAAAALLAELRQAEPGNELIWRQAAEASRRLAAALRSLEGAGDRDDLDRALVRVRALLAAVPDVERADQARLRDAERDLGVAVDDLRELLDKIPTPRAAAASPRCYTVAGHPVKVVARDGGGETTVVYDWQRGELVADGSYWARLFDSSEDVEVMSAEDFDAAIEALRRERRRLPPG